LGNLHWVEDLADASNPAGHEQEYVASKRLVLLSLKEHARQRTIGAIRVR
jgi:hypothetical protein